MPSNRFLGEAEEWNGKGRTMVVVPRGGTRLSPTRGTKGSLGGRQRGGLTVRWKRLSASKATKPGQLQRKDSDTERQPESPVAGEGTHSIGPKVRWGLGICESDMGLGTRDSEVSGREKETHGVSGGWRGTVRKMGGGVCNGNTEGGLVASDCQWLTTTDRTPRTTFITGTPPLLIWLLIWLAK